MVTLRLNSTLIFKSMSEWSLETISKLANKSLSRLVSSNQTKPKKKTACWLDKNSEKLLELIISTTTKTRTNGASASRTARDSRMSKSMSRLLLERPPKTNSFSSEASSNRVDWSVWLVTVLLILRYSSKPMSASAWELAAMLPKTTQIWLFLTIISAQLEDPCSGAESCSTTAESFWNSSLLLILLLLQLCLLVGAPSAKSHSTSSSFSGSTWSWTS